MLRSGRAVRLGPPDLSRLKELCIACSAFFEVIEGQAADEATAVEILGPLEPRYRHGTKHVWGVEAGGELIAVAELLEGQLSKREPSTGASP